MVHSDGLVEKRLNVVGITWPWVDARVSRALDRVMTAVIACWLGSLVVAAGAVAVGVTLGLFRLRLTR